MPAILNSTKEFTRLALQLNIAPEFFYTVADNLERVHRQIVLRYFDSTNQKQVSAENYAKFREGFIRALLDLDGDQ